MKKKKLNEYAKKLVEYYGKKDNGRFSAAKAARELELIGLKKINKYVMYYWLKHGIPLERIPELAQKTPFQHWELHPDFPKPEKNK